MAVSDKVDGLCRLCMCAGKDEMIDIFQDDNSVATKILACVSVEVRKGDQLSNQMCLSCVYQLEKFYIFRKQCRATDTKFRSFLRKVKSKKIQRLDELSEDEDGDAELGSVDTNVAYVQEYERKRIDAELKNDRKNMIESLRKTILEAIDRFGETTEEPPVQMATIEFSFDDEQEHKLEVASKPDSQRVLRETSPHNPSPPPSPSPEDGSESDASILSVGTSILSFQGNHKYVVLKNGLIFDCKQCGRKFHTKDKLDKHLNVHKAAKNTCVECGKCFSTVGSLSRHVKIHRPVKAYQCKTCNKSFSQKGSLDRHSLVHQTISRPFACGKCGKSFGQRTLLTQHDARMHPESPVEFMFRCNVCPKTFRHSSGLSRHSITHSGVKFKCEICHQTLSDYSALKRHGKLVHGKGK